MQEAVSQLLTFWGSYFKFIFEIDFVVSCIEKNFFFENKEFMSNNLV